ncbi:MAG: hypothetical protein K2X38_05705, partial [Gemmataceae bacterium]|nr:hypothetical protein [Gemmataceae bacterium]
MSQSVDELYQAALSLPDDARAELAEMIAASLPASLPASAGAFPFLRGTKLLDRGGRGSRRGGV